MLASLTCKEGVQALLCFHFLKSAFIFKELHYCIILQNADKELLIYKLRKIAAGFLSSCGEGKTRECLLPFKVFTLRIAAKRQGKMCKLFTNSFINSFINSS